MKILLDTNVVLDHFLERKPFAHAAGLIFTATEQRKLETYVGATTVTTIHYLATKSLGSKQGRSVIERLLRLFELAPLNRTILASALLLKFSDFEDAVLHEAAIHSGAQAIVTRECKGFENANLSVYSADEFIVAYTSLNL